jgi:tetratricopeptide (TPR) repeat protein
MAHETSVSDLVVRWQELCAQGKSVSAEELCADCPEQLEEVRRQLKALHSMQQFLDASAGPIAGSATPASIALGNTIPLDSTSTEPQTLELDLRSYVLSEQVGRGGMGQVYRASDPALGRDLAVKVMEVELRGLASAERRFLREARVTGSLQHPGIVPVYNLGRLADGRLHYTMRLVRGQTFADTLTDRAGKPEQTPALLAIFEKVCQAVAYAHSKRVIHRDLKPANIMVGRFGEAQVMDWGLAKLLTAEDDSAFPDAPADSVGTRVHTELADSPAEVTRAGREMGTPAYMPPEQALGEWDAVDERADVFALGAILCEILTGQPVFRGGDAMDALRKAKRGDRADALARLDRCGADATLVALCRECLASEREGRPRDAGVVAERLAAYQAEVQERLRRAELERVAAEMRAREEQARALVEEERTREALARVAAERRARRRLLGLAAAVVVFVLAGVAGLAAGLLAVQAEQRRTRAALDQVTTEQEKTRAALAAKTAAWKRTREALNTVTDDAVAELLGRQAALGDKEKAFLSKLLGFYEDFAAERGEGEETRAVSAEGQARVARLRGLLGERAVALQGYRAAARLYENLAADFPARPEYRRELARSYGNIAVGLAAMAKFAEAEALYNHALGPLEDLVREFPAVPENRYYLAMTRGGLGWCLRHQGKHAQAQASYNREIALLRELVTDFPDRPQYQQALARSYDNLGAVLNEMSKGKESEAAYRRGLAVLERLARDFPADAGYRELLAYNYHDLALLMAKQGKDEDAELAHRVALRLRVQLADEFPAQARYRFDLALSYGNLGRVLRGRHKSAEAEQAYQQCFPLLEKLAGERPAEPRYREYLAYHRRGFADVLADLGKHTEAEAAYQRAIALLQALADEAPGPPYIREELAHGHNGLGMLLANQGRGLEAEAAYRKALTLREKLARDFPNAPEHHKDLAGSYVNLGDRCLARNQPEPALEWYGKAIPLLERVLTQETGQANAREFLRNALWGRAQALGKLGRHAEAARDWKRAVELDDGSNRTLFRMKQSAALARAGDHRAAIKAVEEVMASPDLKGKTPAPLLYDAACVYAVSAAAAKDHVKLRDVYASRALALLSQAQAAGFFKDPKRVENFKKNSDLDALRQRPDYQKFAAEMAAKTEPR